MPPNPPCSRQLSQSCLLLSATFHNLRLLEAKKFCVTVTQVAACFPHKPVEPPVTAGQTVQQQPRSKCCCDRGRGGEEDWVRVLLLLLVVVLVYTLHTLLRCRHRRRRRC